MRLSTLPVVLVLCTLGLAGCAGGGTSSSTSPGGAGGAVGKPHYGGELRIGSGSAHMKTMLPEFADTEGSADTLPFMYDTLVNQDENFKIVPWLATKWDISKDGKTYTFHLRHNATWSDGVPITSADFLFAYNFEKNPSSNAPYSSDYDIVSSVTAPDKWTVVYTLNAPNAPFLASVAGGLQHAPLPVHIYGKMAPDQLQHLDLTKKMVTSGGYTLVEWKPDDHLIMQSNPHWWHGRPYIDRIYVKEYETDTATEVGLENGDIDTTYALPTPQWLALKDNPQFTLIHNYADLWNWWVPNLKTPILSDLHVRQAFMYGYDRVTEAKRLFHNEDIPCFSPVPLAQRWAVSPAAFTAYPYDPAKAAAILDADGWKMGPDGYRYKNGTRLEINTGLIAGNDVGSKDFELLQANMKAIGMKLDAHQYEINVYYEQEAKGQFELDGGGFGGGGDPDVYQFFDSASIPPNGLNYARYDNPKMDALIAKERETSDQAQRAKYFDQIEQLTIADIPAFFDVAPYYRDVVNKRILGVDPKKAGSFYTQTMYHEPEWWVAQ